jgi:peptidoglycan/xylan/chitin deacetylase (PgdA/CDA1 family)
MRFVAVMLLFLAGGIVSAPAQSVLQPAEPSAAATPAQLVETSAAQPDKQSTAKPAEQPVAQPAEQQAAKPIAQPADQQVAKPIEQAVAKPAEPAAEQSAAKPAEQQVAKPIEQPIAQPAERQAVKPIEQAVAKPAEPAAEQPVAQPAAKKVAEAAEPGCPSHPDALGTSRVITISPSEYQLLGTIQYKKTLPLKDHEVVLTFDDGPIPPYTNSILDTLAANCVKATYFLVGEMAHARPYLVRRIYNEGHSIGTHTQHHPFAMQRLSMQRVEREVDGGIASVDTALGDPRAVSPFFRIPGLGRTNAIEHFLENKGLVTWSADVDTDDWWRGTTPGALIQRAMRRLNARGRGIILMHDIHPATALALPALLKALKAGGYHVVHVVATGERPKALPEVVATPAEKAIWPRVLHGTAEKSGAAMSALRHRVKAEITSNRSHRRVTKHAARSKDAAKINYAAIALQQKLHGF